jgi:hypothetical protein
MGEQCLSFCPADFPLNPAADLTMTSTRLLSLLLVGASLGDLRAAESAVIAPPPFAAPLQWTTSDALVRPVSDARGIVSVKDPSIVRYNDRWHITMTAGISMRPRPTPMGTGAWFT